MICFVIYVGEGMGVGRETERAEKMAQQLERLLCKQEELSSDPQSPNEHQEGMVIRL